MAFEVDLEELQVEKTIDSNKILNEYFTPENIELKTEINAPFEFTVLENITVNFNDLINLDSKKVKRKIDGVMKEIVIHKHNFVKVPKILQDFIDCYRVNMVSRNRKSRIEVADVLKAMKEQQNGQRSLLDKLTGMNKEK